MSAHDKRLFILILVIFLFPHFIVKWMDTRAEEEFVIAEVSATSIPNILSIEDPDEDAKITAALLERGYFRDDVPLTYELQDIAQTSCEEFDVPYSLALAVMEQESGFDVNAVGVDGNDIGLFQIRTSNHDWLAEETGADPLTVEGNIVCGVWFLSYLHDYYNDNWPSALTCWRWGLKDEDGGEYARSVLALMEKWEDKTS